MISSASKLPAAQHKQFTRTQSLVLVFICTLVGAAAQVLMKLGGSALPHSFDPVKIVTNIPLIGGYACYGLNTLLLMIALRDGELSKLYPVIALTFVWVNILSMTVFHESINTWKIGGILAIMLGVSVLGRASAVR